MNKFWGVNKMAKGPRSVSRVAQSQSKTVYRVAGAETEEAVRKMIKNLKKLQGRLGSHHQNTGCPNSPEGQPNHPCVFASLVFPTEAEAF